MRRPEPKNSSGHCSTRIEGKRFLLPFLVVIVALALTAGLVLTAGLALTAGLTLTARVLLTLTTHVALLTLTARALLSFAAHAALAMLFSFSSFTTGILFTIGTH